MEFISQLLKTSSTVRVVAGVLAVAVCLAIAVAEPGAGNSSGGVRRAGQASSHLDPTGVNSAIDKVEGAVTGAAKSATGIAKEGVGAVSETLGNVTGGVN